MKTIETKPISFRMDADLKREAEETLAGMGLTFSTAITLVAKAIVRDGKFPFEIMIDPFETVANQKVLKERIEAMESGETKPIYKTMEELDVLCANLVNKNG